MATEKEIREAMDRISAAALPKCEYCGKALCVPDGGPHWCPESAAATTRKKLVDAITLLGQHGYTVLPPAP